MCDWHQRGIGQDNRADPPQLNREVIMGPGSKPTHCVSEGIRKAGQRVVKAEQQRVHFATVSCKAFLEVQAKCAVTPSLREGSALSPLEMLFLRNNLLL